MDTIAKKVIAFTQLVLAFGVILMIVSNKTLRLIVSQYEISLLVLSIFWMSISLFIALISKEKSIVRLPSYENAPPPPDENKWSKRTKPPKLPEKVKMHSSKNNLSPEESKRRKDIRRDKAKQKRIEREAIREKEKQIKYKERLKDYNFNQDVSKEEWRYIKEYN